MNWNNLDRKSIVPRLESTAKAEAIRELITRVPAFSSLRDTEGLERAILAREKVMTTGIGKGVAISHGEAPEMPGVVVALGLSEKGIEFDAVDSLPVHILFVVVNSKLKRGEYLEVLSSLTKLMRKDEVREKVLRCNCSGDVHQVLQTAARRILATA